MQRIVNLIDLVKSFPSSIYYSVCSCKIGFDTAENESLKVCQTVVRQVRSIECATNHRQEDTPNATQLGESLPGSPPARQAPSFAAEDAAAPQRRRMNK